NGLYLASDQTDSVRKLGAPRCTSPLPSIAPLSHRLRPLQVSKRPVDHLPVINSGDSDSSPAPQPSITRPFIIVPVPLIVVPAILDIIIITTSFKKTFYL
ncbi:hypothetical protein WG66_005606, partial [Moniliophthora roreri]